MPDLLLIALFAAFAVAGFVAGRRYEAWAALRGIDQHL